MNAPLAPLRRGRLSREITPLWSELIGIIAEADDHEETYEPEDLAEELNSANFDPAAHSFAVWSGDRLIAYACVYVRQEPRFDGLGQVAFEVGVHPGWRGRDIEESLVTRCEAIGRRLIAERTPGIDYVIRIGDRSADPTLLAVLNEHGYRLARTFHDMQRPVPGASPLPDLSEPLPGVVVRPMMPSDGEAMRLAHNDAFRQHWGSGPMEPTAWRELLESRTARPEASRVAVDGDGRVLSYAFVGQWTPDELYVLLVGTRHDHQHRGLARAVLSEVLRAADASAESVHRIDLDVDTDSPTDAGRLYTAFGFATVRTMAVYQKDEARAGR